MLKFLILFTVMGFIIGRIVSECADYMLANRITSASMKVVPEKRITRKKLIELINGFLYFVIIYIEGINARAILFCLLASALIVISITDWRVYQIPASLNIFIAIISTINMFIDFDNIFTYLVGTLAVSVFLLLLYFLSRGRAIGGGDVKLMAAAGLFLGWPKIIIAFIIGCILAAGIHLIRMFLADEDNILAFAPYLSVGIIISELFGRSIVYMYLTYL